IRRSPRHGIRWGWLTPCGSPSRPAEPRSWPAACRAATWPSRPARPKECWIKGPTAARRAALDILGEVRAGATLDEARDRLLTGVDERDRRLAYQLCAGILRRQAQLDRQLALSSTDGRLHDILRLGLYQLRHLDRLPAHAAVSTCVELARARAGGGAARFVN